MASGSRISRGGPVSCRHTDILAGTAGARLRSADRKDRLRESPAKYAYIRAAKIQQEKEKYSPNSVKLPIE